MSGTVEADAGNGLYGRFDGDFSLSVGLGGGVSWQSKEAQGLGLAELRARYIDAVGPFLVGQWGPDAGELVALGLELRPLFPGMFLRDLSTHHEFVDLLVQSVGIDLGAALTPLRSAPGVGFLVGFGAEAPIIMPSPRRPSLWLRLGARFIRASPDDRNGPSRDQSGWTLSLTVVMRWKIDTGLAGWEPVRYR